MVDEIYNFSEYVKSWGVWSISVVCGRYPLNACLSLCLFYYDCLSFPVFFMSVVLFACHIKIARCLTPNVAIPQLNYRLHSMFTMDEWLFVLNFLIIYIGHQLFCSHVKGVCPLYNSLPTSISANILTSILLYTYSCSVHKT